MKQVKDRTIEKLRRHKKWGGAWSYSYEDGHVRADGARYFGRASTSMCCPSGCDHWRSTYYIALPVHGPVRLPERYPTSHDRYLLWREFEEGHLAAYEEEVYDIGDSWRIRDS